MIKTRKLILLCIIVILFSSHNCHAKENESSNNTYVKYAGAELVLNEIDTMQIKPTEIVFEDSESVVINQAETNRIISANDRYLLAKIVKAEAGICDMNGKINVAKVILNRVDSDEFPDSVEEVIKQNEDGVYQFSPVGDGKFYSKEPDEECYKAVDAALNDEIEADKALYFTSQKEASTWHSRNLTFLFQCGNNKFYR